MFKCQGFKAHANNVCLWLRISAVSSECNSAAELTFDVNLCHIVQYFETEYNNTIIQNTIIAVAQ